MSNKEPLFSAKNRKLITNPLNVQNPITIQVLGICSALAVTAKLEPAIVMSISVIFVVVFSNVIISLLRNTIPARIRIIVQLVIVAALVIVVDQILKAYAYEVSKQLSVFVGLIITNCIIMGRAEAFAQKNPPIPALIDGFFAGLGYTGVLLIVSLIREVLGFGTILGMNVNFIGFQTWTIAIMPPAAFFIIGSLIWGLSARAAKKAVKTTK